MKYSNLIATFFATLLISAQIQADGTSTTTTAAPASNTTTVETNTNNVLLNNAATSQQYLQQSGYTESTNKFLKGSSPDAVAARKANLTDQEKQLVDNYVDQAGANKILKEKCVGEMKQACAGEEVDHKIMGMSPAMVKMATQAYATIGALGDFLPVKAGDGKWIGTGGDAKTDAKTGAKPDAKPAATKTGGESTAADKKPTDADKDKKAEDYCKYIPAATETIAKFTQSSNVKAIDAQVNNGGETSQKEGLLKAAKSHDSRAQQAQIQAVGWYGGGACYAYKAMSGAFAVDTALVVKLAASTLLGTFYQMEVSANKEYAQKTRDIANSLPEKGQCNPVTEVECYCAEEEHKNDPRYCQAQIAARNAAAASFTRVACVDNTMKVDPNCACDKSNTCFDRVIENLGAGDMQMGIGTSNSPFKSIASLAHGKLENSNINGGGFAQTAAIAKKALAQLSTRVPSGNNPLTLSQKEAYDALVSKGIPSNAARLMAMNPPSNSAMDSAKSKMSGLGSTYDYASYSPGKNNVVDFSGGNGLGLGGRKGDKKNDVGELLGKLNPNKNAASNAKILEFAQKAERQAAQVSKADKPIFDIISFRYQTSGRRLLQLDSAPAP